jgi:hypothetical protein
LTRSQKEGAQAKPGLRPEKLIGSRLEPPPPPPDAVQRAVGLRNRDILRLVYLCCGCGVVTSGGVGRRRGAVIGRDIEGADDVLRDSRKLGIVTCLHRIIVPYWTLISADLLRESGAAATSIIASIAAGTISFLMFSLLTPNSKALSTRWRVSLTFAIPCSVQSKRQT